MLQLPLLLLHAGVLAALGGTAHGRNVRLTAAGLQAILLRVALLGGWRRLHATLGRQALGPALLLRQLLCMVRL
jgi:hypothetical protein